MWVTSLHDIAVGVIPFALFWCCECVYSLVSVESTGALGPDVLMEEAVKVLMSKCEHFLMELGHFTNWPGQARPGQD